MRAIIPVAGFGSRLKPHTFTIPKVLLNVGGKPILGHIIDTLLDQNISKATFVYGHLGDLIIDYVKQNYPSLCCEFVEQKELLGLGHAIYTAAPTFDSEEIFIILGDTIFDVDLKKVLNSDKSSLGVKYVDDPSRFGVAVLENGIIKKLVEKPTSLISNIALVGLYYIKNPSTLKKSLEKLVDEDIKTRGEYQLTDALQMMITDGEEMTTFNVEGWYDCGKPETLLATNKYLLGRKGTHKLFPNTVVIPPVFVADTATVNNSVIGPYTTIGDKAVVTSSIIQNSIIGDGATVNTALLDKSIIGNNTAIKGSYKRLNTGDSSEIDFY
ncbi:MAG: sugar phosphate nucleotidyltransferase [Ignavibacteriaceae bacterium]